MSKNKDFTRILREEFNFFENQSGQLPRSEAKYKDIEVVWVVSGAGSYLHPIIDTPSDQSYKKFDWYAGQDKVRLDYAKEWLRTYDQMFGRLPILIYNGTNGQNADLLSATKEGLFAFPRENIFIPSGKIKNTIEQVNNFSLPTEFKKKKIKLAVLSHSAHLPRILRFISNYPKPFLNAEILPLSINVSDPKGQEEMRKMEHTNLINYIKRGEASTQAYPFLREGDLSVEISPITKEDLIDVFNISNQSDVRAVSFNSAKIELSDHKKWFARKLKDKNAVMLKAILLGEFAGQVRLDVENDQAIVGVSVSERYRGKGIASKLLREAIAVAKKRKIKSLLALIKVENIASIALFERNKFTCVGEREVSGFMAKEYLYKL